MKRTLTRLAVLAAVAFVAYVGYGIYDAGLHDRPTPPATNDIVFKHGSVAGQRITTRSWSADYERILSNADQSVLQLDDVRHGIIYNHGRPYLRVRAAHMTVNTTSRDFTETGPMHVETIGGQTARSFDTDAATWSDVADQLRMTRSILVHNGPGPPMHVGSLTIDVHTGQIELRALDGPIEFK